jgi:hypothetical protein
LAESGVWEQNIIKITGHSNAKSVSIYILVNMYLQMAEDHHKEIIEKMKEHVTELEAQDNMPPPMASVSMPI